MCNIFFIDLRSVISVKTDEFYDILMNKQFVAMIQNGRSDRINKVPLDKFVISLVLTARLRACVSEEKIITDIHQVIMKPLEKNVKLCVLLGLFAISDDFKAKLFAFLSNLVLTANTLFLVSISSVYFYKNISDVEKATYAFYVISAGLISLAWNGIILKQQTPFKDFLRGFQRIIVESKFG